MSLDDIKQGIRNLRIDVLVSDDDGLCTLAQEEILTVLAQLELAGIACRKAAHYQAEVKRGNTDG